MSYPRMILDGCCFARTGADVRHKIRNGGTFRYYNYATIREGAYYNAASDLTMLQSLLLQHLPQCLVQIKPSAFHAFDDGVTQIFPAKCSMQIVPERKTTGTHFRYPITATVTLDNIISANRLYRIIIS